MRAARTAADYRLFALSIERQNQGWFTHQATPGLESTSRLWRLPATGFGLFVASLPPPMAICKVRLSDGPVSSGSTCESWATLQAGDISSDGGWRAYRAAGTVVSRVDDALIWSVTGSNRLARSGKDARMTTS